MILAAQLASNIMFAPVVASTSKQQLPAAANVKGATAANMSRRRVSTTSQIVSRTIGCRYRRGKSRDADDYMERENKNTVIH